ncbi:hypothetical protein HK099_001200, partial [Clydaea vesicula]
EKKVDRKFELKLLKILFDSFEILSEELNDIFLSDLIELHSRSKFLIELLEHDTVPDVCSLNLKFTKKNSEEKLLKQKKTLYL